MSDERSPCAAAEPAFRVGANRKETAEGRHSSRLQKLPDLVVRYGAASIACFAANLGTLVVLHEAIGIPVEIAYAAALAAGTLVSFLACRRYVFRADTDPIGPQAVRFLGSWALFRGAEYLVFLAIHRVGETHYVLAAIAVQTAMALAKLLFYGRFVFRSVPRRGAFVVASKTPEATSLGLP